MHVRREGRQISFELVAADEGLAGPTLLISHDVDEVCRALHDWLADEFG